MPFNNFFQYYSFDVKGYCYGLTVAVVKYVLAVITPAISDSWVEVIGRYFDMNSKPCPDLYMEDNRQTTKLIKVVPTQTASRAGINHS